MTRASVEQRLVLGVNDEATVDEVKKAYRDIVRTAHPDKGGAPDQWAELQAAYAAVLYDAEHPEPTATTQQSLCDGLGWVVEGAFTGCQVKILSETESTFKVEVVNISADPSHQSSAIRVGTSRFVKKEFVQFGEAVHSAARTVKQPPLVVDDISSVPGGRAASTVEYEVEYSKVMVRGAPRTTATPLNVLYKGDRVHAVDVQDGWVKIGEGKWLMVEHPTLGVLLRRVGDCMEDASKDAEPINTNSQHTDPDARRPREAVPQNVQEGGGCAQDDAADDAADADDSHELALAFMPGKLPNFFTGFHEKFFPPCPDEVISEAHLGMLTQSVEKVLEKLREKHRAMEMNSQIDELYDSDDEKGNGIPKVPWTGIGDFPWNEPIKFLFINDWLDNHMPVKYADTGALHEWRFSDKQRAWERCRPLQEMVPDYDMCSKDALDYGNMVLGVLSRIMRADAYGNIVSPFACRGAIGDFDFESFLPRARAGPVADHPDNCTVACVRLWAWKGYLLPHFMAPEHLLCGLSGYKFRLILNLIKSRQEAGPNIIEVVLGYIPNGDPNQPELRIRNDLADPLMGFSGKDAVAAFLQELYWLCEPQGSGRMHGFNAASSLVTTTKWFSDDSPRGDYVSVQHCSICEGEQPFYNMPLGYQSEESPGKCLGYLCENCEFLRHKFFLEDLVADRVLECRLGTTRDREKWAAVSAVYEANVAAQKRLEEQISRMLNPKIDVEKAEAQDMVEKLRSMGRVGDANELQRTLDSDADSDSEPEMCDVY